ncbi:gas vesicle protein [Algihabitans albus]|uniref:gas vesicle protein n=1 Tax=Algihabitans albus TaxID=2164067 RepID=UPI000E5D6DB7|nr:gas vesicle protein [Algihabitans albus]
MQYATGGTNLADILERVLDRGVVIAGDITVSLVEIELLTIKVRLVIASVDRAREIGINWWESDPALSTGAQQLQTENQDLRERIERLERLTGPQTDELESLTHATRLTGEPEKESKS